MKKSFYKRCKKEMHKYVNGTKGVISIFLAMCMLPFTSIALLLTESARYQSVVQMVNELLDCVGFSTLADYDNYLDDRFGLFAVEQSKDINTLYSDYMSKNLKALPNGYSYTSGSAQGEFALSNKDVLRNQIMEFSETTVLVEMLDRGFDIKDLIKDFEKNLKGGEIQKYADATNGVLTTAQKCTSLINAVKDSFKASSDLDVAYGEYNTAASDFYTKADELIPELNDAIGELDSDEDTDSIYSDSDVADKVSACEGARDTYRDKASNLADKIRALEGKIEAIYTSIDGIDSNFMSTEDAINELEGNSSVVGNTGDWVERVVVGITDKLNIVVNQNTYKDKMEGKANDLVRQAVSINHIVCNVDALDKTNPVDAAGNHISPSADYEYYNNNHVYYYINNTSNIDTIKGDYPTFNASMEPEISSSYVSIMEGEINRLDNEESNMSDSASMSILDILDVASSLINLTGLYNGTLDARVNPSCFYHYAGSADLSVTSYLIIDSLSSIVTSGHDFVESLTTFNILKALKAVVEFLKGVVEFLAAIVTWIGEAIINLVKFLASPRDMYDTIMICGYCAYNMPNRTNFGSGSTLTYTGGAGGVTYPSIYSLMGGTSKTDLISGSLDDIRSLRAGAGTGTHHGFYGAETEYLLIGSDSELMNQSATFFNIFLLRLALNLYPILTNTEIQAMASNPAGWAVYLAYIIAEPLADTLIMVNGGNVDLFKTTIFLTPTGLPKFFEKIIKCTGLDATSKDKLKKYSQNVGVTPPADMSDPEPKKVDLSKEVNLDEEKEKKDEKKKPGHTLTTDYTESLCFLLWLTCDESTLLGRIQNIIQMECKQKYQTKSYDFKLQNAYSCIKITAKGDMDAMFDLPDFTNGHVFSVKKTRYVGY